MWKAVTFYLDAIWVSVCSCALFALIPKQIWTGNTLLHAKVNQFMKNNTDAWDQRVLLWEEQSDMKRWWESDFA